MEMKKKFKGLRYRSENDPKKREEAILNNIPVQFDIKRDLKKRNKIGMLDNVWNIDKIGKEVVRKNDDLIREKSKKYNLDPDITRSVMFAENSRGHYGGMNKISDIVRKSESLLPMNIQKNR